MNNSLAENGKFLPCTTAGNRLVKYISEKLFLYANFPERERKSGENFLRQINPQPVLLRVNKLIGENFVNKKRIVSFLIVLTMVATMLPLAFSSSASALTGSTDEEKIWNFFSSKGLPDVAVAGVMGNIYQESRFQSNVLQYYYQSAFGFTSAAYTAAVDKGTYTNFVYDSAGYGLCQWTWYTRKLALYNFAKNRGASVGDLETQLEFCWSELSDPAFNYLKNYSCSISSILMNAQYVGTTTYEKIYDAAESFYYYYENAGLDEGTLKIRTDFAVTLYEKYSSSSYIDPSFGAEPLDYPAGDANLDGKLDVEDARYVLRIAVGYDSVNAGTFEFLAADIDGNGKITVDDSRVILRAAIGLERISM